MVTVYSKPACPQCEFTKRKLTELNIPFETFDVTVDPWARGAVMALGYSAAPVVVVSHHVHWSGYRPDRLNALAENVIAAA